jgi:hypothetical protein
MLEKNVKNGDSLNNKPKHRAKPVSTKVNCTSGTIPVLLPTRYERTANIKLFQITEPLTCIEFQTIQKLVPSVTQLHNLQAMLLISKGKSY